jgi:hypothetical protein
VQVEYVAERPYYSRIKGTINAPYPWWSLLVISSLLAASAFSIKKGITWAKQIMAIVSDAFVTTSIRERMREHQEAEYKTYEWQYTYQYNNQTYTHTFESGSREEFGAKEEILVQRSAPTNAVLAINVPHFVRQKLGINRA